MKRILLLGQWALVMALVVTMFSSCDSSLIKKEFSIPGSEEKIRLTVEKEWYVVDSTDSLSGAFNLWFAKSAENLKKSDYYGFFRVIKRTGEGGSTEDVWEELLSDYVKEHPDWVVSRKIHNNLLVVTYNGEHPDGFPDKQYYIIYSDPKKEHYLSGYFHQDSVDYSVVEQLAKSISVN